MFSRISQLIGQSELNIGNAVICFFNNLFKCLTITQLILPTYFSMFYNIVNTNETLRVEKDMYFYLQTMENLFSTRSLRNYKQIA